MYATTTKKFITRHSKYAGILTLFAILVVFGIYFKKEFIGAVGYSFVQSGWVGGATANTAVHTSNQAGWTEYESISTLSASSSVSLEPYFYTFHDGAGATTTSPIAFSGGTFGAGTHSGTIVRPVWGTGNSVELSRTAKRPLVSAGSGATSYLVKADGTVWSWGSNTSGALGYSPVVNNKTPGQVEGTGGSGFLTDVVGVSAGGAFAVALKSDGTVWSWGEGSNAQLGNGGTDDQAYPVQVLDYDGGNFTPLSNIVSVSAGAYHTLALKNDGTVWAWGDANYGVLGTGQGGQVASAFQVLGPGGVGFLTDIVAISVGSYTSYALKSDGTVYAWGFGQFGNIGNGSNSDSQYPSQVSGEGGVGVLTNVVAISAGLRTAYALTQSGSVYAWGYGNAGELGDNNTGDHNASSPVRVVGENGTGYLSNVVLIESGMSAAYALDRDGALWSWGAGSGGELGNTTLVGEQATPVRVQGLGGVGYLENVIEVSGGQSFVIAVLGDGSVWSWGTGASGQLGNNSTTASQTSPVQVVESPVSDYFYASTTPTAGISGGYYHAVAIKSDDSIWAWGSDSQYQLGNGTGNSPSTSPAQVHGVNDSGFLSNVKSLTAGGYGNLALKFDGTVYAWGQIYGYLSDYPIQVTGRRSSNESEVPDI